MVNISRYYLLGEGTSLFAKTVQNLNEFGFSSVTDEHSTNVLHKRLTELTFEIVIHLWRFFESGFEFPVIRQRADRNANRLCKFKALSSNGFTNNLSSRN